MAAIKVLVPGPKVGFLCRISDTHDTPNPGSDGAV